ncbi:MAG TPA: CDP-alcohol phosphatidyltransferase family protein [Anaerolineales bacterium]|nr:CDP-alcohol phosphatidyltransferase family protein [Anaerolineales bacterium]
MADQVMFDTPLRKVKDRVGAPLARRLSRVSPTTISLIGLVIALIAAWSAYRQIYFAAFALWILNRALDGLDGLLARMHNKQTDFGGYVDILTDFIAYAALPIGLVAGSPSNERYLALAFMLASFYINTASWMYLAAILEKRSQHGDDTPTTIVMPAGLIGGFETIIAFGAFTLFPAHLTTLYIIFAILVFITIAQRLIWAKRILT